MAQGMTFSFKDSLTPALRQKLEKVRDKRPLLQAGGTMLWQCSLDSWRNETMRLAPWPELAPATVAAKEAAGKTAMLFFEGHMKQSLRVGAPSGDTIEIGSDAFYAPFHQFGTARMPARPFIPMMGNGQLSSAAEKRVFAAMTARLNALLT